jgi:hypothetical protein
MSGNKDALLNSLLAPKTKSPSGPMILEMNENGEFEEPVKEIVKEEIEKPIKPKDEEGPTMMEMMMAAQADAKKEKDVKIAVEEKKSAKDFGKGFKKGFFGGSSSKKEKPKETKTLPVSTSSTSSATSNSVSSIPTITKKVNSKEPSVLDKARDDVQKAMQEEAENSNPMLAEIKKGEWATPDLMSLFQSNPILFAGLQDKNCMEAMQLMQKNPEEAQKKFAGNPKVDKFLREFGRVMSSHFDGLAEADKKNSSSNNPPQPPQKELGVLHNEAIQRSKSTPAPKIVEADKNSEKTDKQVKEIINDPELSAMYNFLSKYNI